MGTPDTAHTYSHVFTLAFSLNSSAEDARDIPDHAYRAALKRRLKELSNDEELANAVFPPDETELRDPDGTVTTIKHMPMYTVLDVEAAQCVWEYLQAASDRDDPHCIPAIADVRDRIGSAELRNASIYIGQYCLQVYPLIPEDLRDGHAYDWEIIPAIVSTMDFAASLLPAKPHEDAAAEVVATLTAAPITPAQNPAVDAAEHQSANDEHESEENPTVASEFGICCPNCGSDEHMQVEIKTLADLSADGTDPGPEHEWDDDSYIRCDGCEWQGTVGQCRAEAMPPTAPGTTTSRKRIMAEFVPQAWLNDHAIAVDPSGDTMFDVTEEILKLGREVALQLRDDTDATDFLRQSPNAPQWAKDWSGPFLVNVEQAIADYFGEI